MSRMERIMSQKDWDPKDRYSPQALERWVDNPVVHQRMLEINRLSRELCAAEAVTDTMLLSPEARSKIDDANARIFDNEGSDQ